MQLAPTKEREATGRERLFFEGVQAPVVTRVRRRGENGLTVDQPLPFLSLTAKVRDAAGRNARIRSVGVSVEGGTPHLVLELSYDERREPTARFTSERPPRSKSERRDETVSYTRLRAVDTERPVEVAPPGPRDDDAPIVFVIDPDAERAPAEPMTAPPPPRWWHLRRLRDLLR